MIWATLAGVKESASIARDAKPWANEHEVALARKFTAGPAVALRAAKLAIDDGLDADLDTIDGDGTKLTLYGTDAKDRPNRRWRIVEVKE